MLFQKKHKIGDAIAKLRKEKGWTQNELADKLQVSDKAISKWESNKGDPSIEFLPALAELFGVTLDYLMTGKEVEEKIVTINKLELCAKKDDVDMYKDLKLSLNYKDENGKTIFDYIFKYKSKELFKFLLPSAEHYISGRSIEFYESFYYMRVLCNDVSVIRDIIRLEYIDTTINNHIENAYKDIIGYNGSRLVWVPRKIISDKIIDLILYSKNTNSPIRSAMLSNYKDRGWFSPALSYPYFVCYAAEKNDFKLVKELLENAVKINQENAGVKLNEWQITYLGFIDLPKKLFDILLENEKYELVDLANKNNTIYKERYSNNVLYKDIYILSSYDIESNKIKYNKKLSEKEKQLLYCIHNGVVCLDELISLNDFELYEKTIKKYPISIYEKGFEFIDKKDYKGLFGFVNELGGFNSVIEDLKNKDVEKLQKDYEKSLGYLNSANELNSKYLKRYIYDNHRGLLSSSFINKNLGIDTFATKENFKNVKNYIFLDDVLNNDIRFIEKACKTATQQELDDALTKIQPNNFKGINILLNFGAKLHKTWEEDDGWGYMVNRDEIDEIGTELLKQKIKDILGDK